MAIGQKILRISEILSLPFLSILNNLESKYSPRVNYLYERPIEYAFTLNNLLKEKCLNILDVGTGRSAFPGVLKDCGFKVECIDKKTGYWNFYFNKHIKVSSGDITDSKFDIKYDAVTCISVLEHIPDFNKAVEGMISHLKPGGILILTFPYTHDQFIENVYSLDTADPNSKNVNYITHSFSDFEISRWIKDLNLKEVERSYFRGWSGKFWKTGERINFPEVVNDKTIANGLCLCLKNGG